MPVLRIIVKLASNLDHGESKIYVIFCLFFKQGIYGLCCVVKCVGEVKVFGVMLRLSICHCGPQGC